MRIITDKGVKELINLTPHKINYYDNNKIQFSLSSCTNPPRVEERLDSQETLEVNGSYKIRIHNARNISIGNIPPEKEGRYYIVSRIIAEYSDRDDLLVPHDLVRNEEGMVIGCNSFKKVR